jgi:hypothetical protein
MEITISRNRNESSLAISKLQWKLMSKKYYLFISFCIGTGLLFIITNIKDDSAISLGIGIGFEFFAFFYLFTLLRSRENWNERLKKDLSKQTNPLAVLKINEFKIIYESSEMKLEYSWNVIKSYKIYKGSILLMIDNYLNSFVVLENELSKEQFVELFQFVSKSLPEKK